MKLITAIKLIEEKEKRKRKAEKEVRRESILYLKEQRNSNNQIVSQAEKDLINVQTILPDYIIAALRAEIKEEFIKDAIARAVYLFLSKPLETKTDPSIFDEVEKIYMPGDKRRVRYVHVQSKISQEDIVALKEKTGKVSNRDAISVAVYDFLKNNKKE